MAITNQERVGRGLEQLLKGLTPWVQARLKTHYKDRWIEAARPSFPLWQTGKTKDQDLNWDAQAVLKVLVDLWNDCFKLVLGYSERSLVSELIETRNRHAHPNRQNNFTYDDTYRALDSVIRLLMAISAPEAAEVEKMRDEVLRVKFDEQRRVETRKETNAAVDGAPAAGLRPWREIVAPHPDVESGRYLQAEYAADLWQVFQKDATPEYQDPVEFYRRTYLTEGLQRLLGNAMRRMGGQQADPVVELQTNFGGGKTHSVLALLHLFSDIPYHLLPGLETLVKDIGVSKPARVNRAVLVGNRISPGKVHTKPDGTKVNTLWGELAWQLGKAEGYAMVREADENRVSPGDELRQLFIKFSPCLILIDEWVAYARQLFNRHDLPAGDFDSHFTFAQTLSECARGAPGTLLVVSIPASDNEVGGEGGQLAISRLKNVLGRVESTWTPASTEEGFEIVRRRLFQPITDPKVFAQRDAVVRAFMDEYRKNQGEYPAEASKPDYERRMTAAYPIHPELFDRLFNDWSTLDRFQRTRGVLRLMSAVIHELWEGQDKSLLILPASMPLDAQAIRGELAKVLPDQWQAVLEKDIDSPNALPRQLDRANSNWGRYSACRRVARTVYMGSAATHGAANKGLEDRQIKLGCCQPGEMTHAFGDALRKLADSATYLFADNNRYWYSTVPTVNRLAEESAERWDAAEVEEFVRDLVRKAARDKSEFPNVHGAPLTHTEFSDSPEARLIILGPESAHTAKSKTSAAMMKAQSLLDRGGQGRASANMIVFLAADLVRLGELERAVRQFKAWKDIVDRKDELNLDTFQGNQAATKLANAEKAVAARVPETFIWLLVPGQGEPVQGQPLPPVEWSEFKTQGEGSLAARVIKKVKNDNLLMIEMAGEILKLKMDAIPLWRGNHVPVRQLLDDFAKYHYLPRLRDQNVLLKAVSQGVANMQWRKETFAYAESFDESTGRYLGAKGGELVSPMLSGLVVRAEVVAKQIDEDAAAAEAAAVKKAGSAGVGASGTGSGSGGGVGAVTNPPPAVPMPKNRRFYGRKTLDSTRFSRDVGDIATAIVQHLNSVKDAKVTITIEIAAESAAGAPDSVVQTVTENCRTLKFSNFGFEDQ